MYRLLDNWSCTKWIWYVNIGIEASEIYRGIILLTVYVPQGWFIKHPCMLLFQFNYGDSNSA